MRKIIIFFLLWLLSFIFALFLGMKIKERQLGLFDFKEDNKTIALEMQKLKIWADNINGRLEKIVEDLEQIGFEMGFGTFWNRFQNKAPEDIMIPRLSEED